MKNLLFIMTDHQRFDSIGMIQCGREVTPNLNRLAKEGEWYTRAYTATPLCVPARTALATGVYPCGEEVVHNDWKGESARHHETIHARLQKEGYQIGYAGVHHIRVKPELSEMGFSCFVDEQDYHAYAEQNHLPVSFGDEFSTRVIEDGKEAGYSNSYTGVWQSVKKDENTKASPGIHPVEREEEDFKDSWFLKQGIEFLERRDKEKPFALFLYLWAPHPPLVVPKSFADRYHPDGLALPANIGVQSGNEPPHRKYGISRQLAQIDEEGHWRKTWAAHLGLVTYADELIGKLLIKLKELGLAEQTITLFTSDHGDSLGQHRMYQKMELYEPCVHIPLIIHGNRQAKREFPVSHLDVFPALCEYLGIEPPLHGDGMRLEASTRERMVYFQYSGNPKVSMESARRGAVGMRYKYTVDYYGGEELFDLEQDSLEMVNLAADTKYEAIVSDYRNACRDYHEAKGDSFYRRG